MKTEILLRFTFDRDHSPRVGAQVLVANQIVFETKTGKESMQALEIARETCRALGYDTSDVETWVDPNAFPEMNRDEAQT